MTRRLRDIVALLGSYLDAPSAQPKTWTGELVKRAARRGEVGSKRADCPVCKGEREVRQRGFHVPCSWCKARGWVEVDDYTRRQIATVRTGLVVITKTVHCDVCGGEGATLAKRWRGPNNRCLRCNGGGRLELRLEQWQAVRYGSNGNGTATPVKSGDPVIDCLAQRERAGSYAELAQALEALRRERRPLFRIVWRRYVEPEDLGTLNAAAEKLGLPWLSERMPDEIRVPGYVRQRARAAA